MLDENTLSLIISFSNTLFLLFILSIFSFPNFTVFFFTVFFWIATQLLILYYGISENLIGFIFMPIITIVITIVAIIVQVGDVEELEDIEEVYYED
jgi:hypothetical protein